MSTPLGLSKLNQVYTKIIRPYRDYLNVIYKRSTSNIIKINIYINKIKVKNINKKKKILKIS